MKRLLVLAAAALATAACHHGVASAPANEAAANITTLDAANLGDDANITDVPADDGDAPADTETNAR